MPKLIDTNDIRFKFAHGKMVTQEEVIALCDEIDRLRGEQQTPPQFQGHTVPAEAYYAVDRDGYYKILGICGDSATQDRIKREVCDDAAFDDGPVAFGTITATLPVPVEVTVVAKVEGE